MIVHTLNISSITSIVAVCAHLLNISYFLGLLDILAIQNA